MTRGGSSRSWRRLRELVFDTYGRACIECGAPATHVDHLEPVALGGTDTLDNLRPMCATHNLAKGARPWRTASRAW